MLALLIAASPAVSPTVPAVSTLLPPRPQVHQYHRLVYNRVPKCGSSTLIALVKLLAARNNFTLVNDAHFWPSAKRLKDTISALPQRTFYINHAGFWPDAPPNVGWINMVREPLDWLNTRFYYEVDESRGDDAQVTLQKRFEDTQCGCYKLEYDECVRTQHLNGCPLSTGAEDLTRFACGPHERGCGVNHEDKEEERAYHMKTVQSRVEERFVFVGLTEEYVRSIRMLEVLLPDWFDGASELLLGLQLKRETSEENLLTGTTMTGCLSKESRRLLTADPVNRGLLDFYANVQERFWRQYASLEDDLTNASRSNAGLADAMMRLKTYDSPMLDAQVRPKACSQ
jgi:hypothetical protein